VVKNRIRIGADAIVGAGAVVIRDVAAGSVVAGVPARALRRGNAV
jgi:acetyltransferase-like isoleucine patch superfamily enzyme